MQLTLPGADIFTVDLLTGEAAAKEVVPHPGYLGTRYMAAALRRLSSTRCLVPCAEVSQSRRLTLGDFVPLGEKQRMFPVKRELCCIMETAWAWLNFLSLRNWFLDL